MRLMARARACTILDVLLGMHVLLDILTYLRYLVG